mmetsp:Transcript_6956/g.17061  ORF Transcript_6956/g.17061 Transcript_6956/m.17061 type:complete len:301 (-) Transcript_6956:182-1084(-)
MSGSGNRKGAGPGWGGEGWAMSGERVAWGSSYAKEVVAMAETLRYSPAAPRNAVAHHLHLELPRLVVRVDDDAGHRGVRRRLEHRVHQRRVEDPPQPAGPGAAAQRGRRGVREGLGRNGEADAVHGEEFGVLLGEGVARGGEDGDEVVVSEGVEGDGDGEAADEFGDDAEGGEVGGLDVLGVEVAGAGGLGGGVEAVVGDVLEAVEGAAADEEDLGGVHGDDLAAGVVAAAAFGDVDDGALEELEERLLHALAGDVAGDARGECRFARAFVELVNLVAVETEQSHKKLISITIYTRKPEF